MVIIEIINFSSLRANLLKGKDAKSQVYGSSGTMMAGFQKANFWRESNGAC